VLIAVHLEIKEIHPYDPLADGKAIEKTGS
jgi:hypothetical protein